MSKNVIKSSTALDFLLHIHHKNEIRQTVAQTHNAVTLIVRFERSQTMWRVEKKKKTEQNEMDIAEKQR